MSLSIQVKRTFLSFAQQFFRDTPTGFVWNPDARLTKIFIGDKFSARTGTAEKYPAIILAENTKRWGRTAIDQRQEYPGFAADHSYKVRSDLVVGSLTFQCLSPNGIEAEQIADFLFTGLVGYKDDFRERRIHQILDIQMGETQQIRSDNEGRLYLVPVSVFYATQSTIATTDVIYDLRIYTNFNTSALQSVMGIDDTNLALMYSISGQTITFNDPPASGLILYAAYLQNITLNEINEIIGTGDGFSTVYMLSSLPYTAYYAMKYVDFTFTPSGLW